MDQTQEAPRASGIVRRDQTGGAHGPRNLQRADHSKNIDGSSFVWITNRAMVRLEPAIP